MVEQDMYDARHFVCKKIKEIYSANFSPRELFILNQAVEELEGIESQDLETSFQSSTYNTEIK